MRRPKSSFSNLLIFIDIRDKKDNICWKTTLIIECKNGSRILHCQNQNQKLLFQIVTILTLGARLQNCTVQSKFFHKVLELKVHSSRNYRLLTLLWLSMLFKMAFSLQQNNNTIRYLYLLYKTKGGFNDILLQF